MGEDYEEIDGCVLIPFNRAYPLGPYALEEGDPLQSLNPVQQGISARTKESDLPQELLSLNPVQQGISARTWQNAGPVEKLGLNPVQQGISARTLMGSIERIFPKVLIPSTRAYPPGHSTRLG